MMRGWQKIVVVAALVAGCGDNNKVQPPVDGAPDADDTPAKVARGQYIMNVLANCTFCHTPLRADGTRDTDKLLSGVDCFIDVTSADFTDDHDNIGCVSTRNLTPDPTGLGTKTATEIKNAFRNGVRTDGKKLAPLMPFWIFHNMSDADADAIVAYLRTIPAVSHTVKPNEPPWSDYNDGNIPQPPYIDVAKLPAPKAGVDMASALRGRYLSAQVGLCVDCHSPTVSEDFVNNLPGTLTVDQDHFFTGGRIFPKGALGLLDASYPPVIVTRNLTPDATGLDMWTRDQIKNAIAIGKDPNGNAVCAATHGGVISPYAALEPQDLTDIVEYIFSLTAVANDTAAKNCGPPQVGNTAETGNECLNGTDDDGDQAVNDGCYYPCGNCEGPPVQN